MRIRKILLIIIAIASLIVAAFLVLPWQAWVQQKLINMLSAKGFAAPALTIDHIGLHGLVLKNVTLGDPPLKLETLTISYAPRAAMNGQINDVAIEGLAIRAVETSEGWKIEGMAAMTKSKERGKPVAIPVTLDELQQLPFASVSLHDAQLSIVGQGWQVELPVNGELKRDGEMSLHLESTNAHAALGEDAVAVAAIVLDLKLDEPAKQWRGTWSMKDIVTTSETLTLPALQLAGDLTIGAETLDSQAKLTSPHNVYAATGATHIAFNKPSDSLFTLSRATMPLSGGTIAVNNVRVPLQGNKPIAVKLQVDKVAIASVMSGLTGDKVTATGAISGSVPVTIARDGVIRVGNTALEADAPGIIALSPEVIPGDNAQVALVRDVLKNLHYTVLALGLDMTPDRQLKAVLVVEGSNPDIEKGRPIKLKVQLSGDLLDLLMQNLKLMTDPKTFIQQHVHETL